MSYIDIEKSDNHGLNLDALLSNLGYCLSNTMSDDFYDKLFKIGVDLVDIVLSVFDEEKLSGILHRSIENTKYINCGCTINQYNINSCHIGDLSRMIKSLSSFASAEGSFIAKLKEKHDIVDFYTAYFVILKRSDKYISLLDNPTRLLKENNK